MPNGGEALGLALGAAMLIFADHDGSPQAPSRGYLSAKLASEFVHLEAGGIRRAIPGGAFVKPATTGRILAGYISDIDRVAQKTDDAVASGVSVRDNPSVPGSGSWGAQLNKEELRRVMKEASADSEAFALVVAAETAFAGQLLDRVGAARWSPGGAMARS